MLDNNSNYSNEINDTFESYKEVLNNQFERNIIFQQEYENFLDNDENNNEINNEINENNDNDTAYKLLKESNLTLYINKKGEEPFINYDNIIYDNGLNKIAFNELKNLKIGGESWKLENNYKKFVGFLEETSNSMKKEFINNYQFKITLFFKMEKYYNKKKFNDDNTPFKIDCLYKVEIPGEEIMEFKDYNILVNGASEGLVFLINEIKYANYEE